MIMKKTHFIVKKLFSLGLLGAVLFATSCSSDDGTQETTTPPVVTPPVVVTPTFPGPTYADNYSSISSWGSNSKWNLANVHDPSVAKCGDYYYMYQTDASYGNATEGHGHFFYRRSKDLINWEFMGSSMTTAPAWVKDSLNNKRARMNPALPAIANPRYGYWAPCIRKVGNIYRMYYSIVVDEPIVGADFTFSWSERAFIGLMESTDLATNVWVDKGMVVCSEPDGVKPYSYTGARNWEDAYFKFNAIDPTFVETPEADQYLVYGSWHSGIASLKLNPTTGKPDQLKTLSDYGTRIASRSATSRWQASEGPEIIYNPDTQYYYLFLAYDGLEIPYNTRVCRSKSITGPFVGINGANVTNGADCWPMLTHPYSFNNHTGWVGFAHCAIFQNPDTKEWFYSSQARLPKDVAGINVSNAIMMGHVRAIQWTEDGWPVIAPERYAGVPTTTITQASFIGTWEQITMNYQYGVIQKSATIYLTADGKVSGGVSGTWSYDATKKTLTVNGVPCKVSDAWDWESATRKVTITYSGLTEAGVPVWGKKIN
jgi:arabinan endo-1,5-alpha-L-arabinosidase